MPAGGGRRAGDNGNVRGRGGGAAARQSMAGVAGLGLGLGWGGGAAWRAPLLGTSGFLHESVCRGVCGAVLCAAVGVWGAAAAAVRCGCCSPGGMPPCAKDAKGKPPPPPPNEAPPPRMPPNGSSSSPPPKGLPRPKSWRPAGLDPSAWGVRERRRNNGLGRKSTGWGGEVGAVRCECEAAKRRSTRVNRPHTVLRLPHCTVPPGSSPAVAGAAVAPQPHAPALPACMLFAQRVRPGARGPGRRPCPCSVPHASTAAKGVTRACPPPLPTPLPPYDSGGDDAPAPPHPPHRNRRNRHHLVVQFPPRGGSTGPQTLDRPHPWRAALTRQGPPP